MIDLKFQKQVIEANGRGQQTIIHMEELSELQKAVAKMERWEAGDPAAGLEFNLRRNLIEELADVQICIAQIMVMYDISQQSVDNEIDRKQDRQKKRFKDDRN